MNEERRRDEHADDALIEAAWRNASRGEPPASLDAAILAAARAEARRAAPGQGVAARRAWWARWQPLAAAAGVAGLAFVLVQTIPREAPLPSPAERNAARVSDAEPTILPPARTPTPTATPAASPAVRPAAEDALAEGDALSGVAPQETASAEAAAPMPDAWARRIAALHAAGQLSSAAAELREFRRAFPDADRFLPDDLRDWAAKVPGPDAP